jgi:hypothetical protein
VVEQMPEPTIVRPKAKKRRLKKPRSTRTKVTVDPKFVALSRELRDRWQERVDVDPSMLPEPRPVHDVRRSLVPARDETKALPMFERANGVKRLAA